MLMSFLTGLSLFFKAGPGFPCHEIVKIDYFLPGCPPHADLIWDALLALVTGRELKLEYKTFKFD